MIPDDQEFISNLANTLASDIIKKMQKAQEYFREDPECNSKCLMMHHLVICHIMKDYIMLFNESSKLRIKELFEIVKGDTILLINQQAQNDTI